MKRFKALPIQTQLALKIGGTLAAVLFLVGVGIYQLLRMDLTAKIDRKLLKDLERAQATLSEPTALPSGKPRKEAHWWESWQGDQLLRVEKDIIQREQLPSLAQFCPRSGAEWFGFYGVQFRVVCQEYGDLTLRAFRTTKDVDFFLSRFQEVALFALPFVVLLCSLFGWWSAGRALYPIDRMTEDAIRIRADKMEGRLTIVNQDDALGRLGTVLNRLFDEIDQSLNRLKQFTADVSHELRTPLAAIRVIGEVSLTQSRVPSTHKTSLESILEEVERLGRMIDSMLLLSRGDAGHLKLKIERIDLAQMTKKIGDHLGVLAEERQQQVRMSVPERPLWIDADPMLVEQAVSNVLDNAIKHTPAGSHIEIQATQKKNRIVLSIEDNGPGVPPNAQKKIFDRFYRLDKSRTQQSGGSGLGLAIAKWATETSQGQISITSTDSGGSKFDFTFPVAEEPPPTSV